MPMTAAQFNQHLWPGIKVFFGNEYDQYPDETKEIFKTSNSDKKFEISVDMSSFGEAVNRADGEPIPYDSMQELWKTTTVMQTIQLAYSITQDVNEDDQYGDVLKRCTSAMAFAFATKKNRDGAAILNNGFSSSYLGGDAVPLFSTGHPLVGGTFSNRPTTGADLDESSLEAAITAIGQFVDARGNPIGAKSTKLIVPTSLQFTADRLVNTVLRVGTTDNDINAIKNMGMLPEGYTVNHYMTDSNQFVVKTNVPNGFVFYDRIGLTYDKEGDFETGNMKYKGRCRYAFAWIDPRCAYSSPGVS